MLTDIATTVLTTSTTFDTTDGFFTSDQNQIQIIDSPCLRNHVQQRRKNLHAVLPVPKHADVVPEQVVLLEDVAGGGLGGLRQHLQFGLGGLAVVEPEFFSLSNEIQIMV